MVGVFVRKHTEGTDERPAERITTTMEKNRSRYELHRKYLKKTSSLEDSVSPSSDRTASKEVTPIENTDIPRTPENHSQENNEGATNSRSKLLSRFHNISSLPDLSVSQPQKIESSPRSPSCSDSVAELSDDIIQSNSPVGPAEESTVEQSHSHQESQDMKDQTTPLSIERTLETDTSLGQGKPLSTLDESQDGNKLQLSALHRRFSASTALSPTQLDSKSLNKTESLENNSFKKPKSLSSPSSTFSEKVSSPNHINHVKPKVIKHDRDHSIGSLTALDTTTTTSDSANSSSLIILRNEPSAMNVPNASGTHRPTEAQLRWSHYHRKERSRKTQLYIEKLMKTPLLPNHVSGMMSGDDDSYTSYEDCKGNEHLKDILNDSSSQPHLLRRKKKAIGFAKKAKNKNIPNLSVGRRVLLRVSARLTQERRLIILEHGFEMEPDSDDGIESSATHDRSRIDKLHNHVDEIGIHSLRDGISMTTGQSSHSGQASMPGSIIGLTVNANKPRRSRRKAGTPHLKGRKSIVNTADENEDRIKRFQEAYSALFTAVLSMQHAATTTMDEIDRENMKRWSRASHITPAISIDGREYYDLQRAPSKRYEKTKNQTLYELIDRGASWLMHLPKQEKMNFLSKFLAENKPDTVAGESHLEDVSSLGQERLLELIEQLQQHFETGGFKGLEKNQIEKSLAGVHFSGQFESNDEEETLLEDEAITSVHTAPMAPTAFALLNQEPQNIPSTASFQLVPEVDAESTSPMTASKSKYLPPIYRGPIIRQGASQNLHPSSDVLMKISSWRMDSEYIDTSDSDDVHDSTQDDETILNPKEEFVDKDAGTNDKETNVSNDAAIGDLRSSESCNAADIDETYHPSPTDTIPDFTQNSENDAILDNMATMKIDDWCNDECEQDTNNTVDTHTNENDAILENMTTIKINDWGNDECKQHTSNTINTQKPENYTNLEDMATMKISDWRNDECDQDTNNTLNQHGDSDGDVASTSDNHFEVIDSDGDRASSSDKNIELSYDDHYNDNTSEDDASLEDIEASLRFCHTFIDTDKASDVSESAAMEDRIMIGNLMLTPEILNKRLHQAISSIQLRSWEQVFYLLSANPWLAEMTDMNSKQYLLHQLSFHGASDEAESKYAAPEELNEHLIRMFPHAAQKLDRDGNLPIHYAAMTLNEDMVPRLLEQFPSGLSVQNFSGHLPLHLSIIAAAESPLAEQSVSCIGHLLNIFPGGLAVQDYDGNLPLHLAASFLTGELAIGIISMMIAKIEKEDIFMRLPKRNRKNLEKFLSDESASFDCIDYSEQDGGDDCMSTLCMTNRRGCNPLMCAIKNSCDWDVINIFLGARQSEDAFLTVREKGKTILQIAIESCSDPPTILSMIKLVPQLVRIRDENGILPIEAICSRRDIPSKIVAAMVLVDLPTNEGPGEGSLASVKLSRDLQGSSWWWINCECDDVYVNIVREILSMTSSHHKRKLCSVHDATGLSIMVCASPKCKKELQKALRFAGRFELQRELHDAIEPANGVKLFDAVDFGSDDELGTRVLLKCYSLQYNYVNDVFLFDGITLNYDLVEENEAFIVDDSPHRFCISTECPSLFLSNYLRDDKVSIENGKGIRKIISILLRIGESIHHLHEKGIIHGAISIASVGRFGNDWKLINLAGSRRMKSHFSPLRLGFSAPPEAVDKVVNMEGTRYIFRTEVMATPAMDIWAFGKLSYELLSGHQLVNADSQHRLAKFLAHWNDERLLNIIDDLEKSPAGPLAADLVFHCLSPNPLNRPRSMNDIMSHSFWR